MNWKSLIEAEAKYFYAVTGALFDWADDDALDWKPATGENWMTTGQLLYYLKLQGKPVNTQHLWSV